MNKRFVTIKCNITLVYHELRLITRCIKMDKLKCIKYITKVFYSVFNHIVA